MLYALNVERMATCSYDTFKGALSKPNTGMTRALRHGMQFGVPMREELVTACVGMRGDAGQVK